jgi:hypothetical protein
MRVSAQLQARAAPAAEQFTPGIGMVWNFVCDYLKQVLARSGVPQHHQFLANHANGTG